MKRYIIIMSCMFLMMNAFALQAQDIENNVSKYTSVNGKLYLQPLADAFGANLNSGFFYSAKIKTFGLHIDFGIKAMYAPIPADKKTFTPQPEMGWQPPAGTILPTIFGDEENVTVNGIELPGGVLDTDFFPLAVPQLTVGSLLGTDFTLRYVKYKIDDEIGDIKLYGWGIRHNLSQYFPLMFVDIAAAYYHQKFTVGDIIDATATFAGLQASYSVSVLTLYGAAGMEKSTLNISYTYTDGSQSTAVAFDLKGENHFRTTIGAALNLYVVKIHADYNMSAQKVISGGVVFGF
ncbi:hypothetical protein J7K93_10170 [bacterium]|nr:hypothetical protein [bacterium]